MPPPPHRLPFIAVLSAIATLPHLLRAQSTTAAGSTTPVHWTAAGERLSDFEITRDTTVSHGGRASIRFVADEDPSSFANVVTSMPAAPYSGHRIRFVVYLRSASLSGGGGVLWARADDASHHTLAFINTQAAPLRGTTNWTPVDVSLDVPSNAIQLFIGVFSSGRGTLWMDDARLETDAGVEPINFGFEDPADIIVPPHTILARSPHEALHAMSPRGLENVSAFTRALGYVRFFHPSAASVRTNWDEFAVHGIRAVERAPDTDRLASVLRALFAPIAPAVTFVRTGAVGQGAIPKPSDVTHVIFWEHAGAGAPNGGPAPSGRQSVYRSVRMIAPLSAIGAPVAIPGGGLMHDAPVPHVPDPAHPLEVALGGGVTIRVPIALYTTDTIVPDSMQTAHPAAATERFSASDRATRIADVALAWSLFQNFYPYFDVVHTDWPGALQVALKSAATDPDADAFQITLERLVAALHDGHGNVFRVSSLPRGTPDMRLGWAEGQVVVTVPGDSGTAHGVQRGDVLLSIDGKPVDAVVAAKSALISGATPQWIRSRVLGSLLSGTAGTMVTVRLRGAAGGTSGTPRNVHLTRSAPRQADEKRPDKIADVAPGVVYVDIDRITDADFTAALPRLQRAAGIIFDMRGYPRQVSTPGILSHLTDTTIHSAHFEIPIETLPDEREVGYVDGAWAITPAFPRLQAHVVFLTGGGAISYAESTMGVIESYHLGGIVGEPTAGTNGNVNPFVLPGGYTVIWTGMRVMKRDGTPHHGVGILPTVPVSPTIAGIRAGRDEVLERAISLVGPNAVAR